MLIRAASASITASCLVLATSTAGARIQGAPTLADATLTHLGLAVPDVEAVAAKYAALFGLPSLPVRPLVADMPDGSKVDIKSAVVQMPNFQIELTQPVSPRGPMYEHLQEFGPSVQHIGLAINTDVPAMRTALEQKGGRWTLGARDGFYAYLDFRDRLGASIEIIRPRAGAPAPLQATADRGLLGGRQLEHFGVAVPDVDAAIGAYVDILGVRPVPATRFPTAPAFLVFPPGMPWSPKAFVMTSELRHGPFGIELIQSMARPTPWTDTLDRMRGMAVQHVAVRRGSLGRDEWIRTGRATGGRWTSAGPPSHDGFAYLDFSDTLGLMFESREP